MKSKGKLLFNIIMTAVCFAFIVCMATTIILYIRPLYYMMVKILDIPEKTGFSYEICKRNYNVLIDYNMIFGPKELVFPDFIMSEHGRIHFEDVKRIFVTMEIIGWAGLPAVLIGYLAAKKTKTFGWLKATIFVALAVVIVVGAGFIIDWDKTFVLMHKILFTNDYWIFYYDQDPVIYILPDMVFLAAGVGILVLITAGLITCGVLYRKNRHLRDESKTRGKLKSR